MKFDLRPSERLIMEGAANLQRGLETVGGRLFLTNSRLFFQSHAFNVQTGPTEIGLSQIRGTERRFSTFLGLIPVLPNALAVLTASGAEYSFVLFGRADWEAAIRETMEMDGPGAVS